MRRAPSPLAALPPRRPRGRPEETRQRLVLAAAQLFNERGYDGTDSNQIARAAGYSPGTFYNHFTDKRDVFIAAYRHWVATVWAEIDRAPAGAEAAVAAVVDLHRRWRGLRASLRRLIVSDPSVREVYLAERAAQLGRLADRLDPTGGVPAATRLLILLLVERAADAVADGEVAALGVKEGELLEALASLTARARRGRR